MLGLENSSEHSVFRCRDFSVLLVVLVVFAWTRVWNLAEYPLDGDEIVSYTAASSDWHGLFTIAINDMSHPPLFYILLKIWIEIGGDSDYWLRLLPVLMGIAVALPVYLICNELRLRPAATNLALALIGVNSYVIFYSQHLRMFALLQLASAFSIWLLLRFVNQGKSAGNMLVLFVVNVVLVYSHYWGWVVVAAEFVVVLSVARRKLVLFSILSVATVVCFIPWAGLIVAAAAEKGTATSQISWMSKPDLSALVWFGAILNGPYHIPRSTTIGLVLFGSPVLFWAWRSFRNIRPERKKMDMLVTLSVLVGLPVIGTFVASHILEQSVWGTRHLIIVTVPYAVLVAVAGCEIPWKKGRTVAVVGMLLWAIGAGILELKDEQKKLRWDVLVDWITRESMFSGTKVVIYATERFVAMPLQFHSNRNGTKKVEVAVQNDLGRVVGQEFWIAYRDITWNDERTPQRILLDRGYRIGGNFSVKTSGQSVTVFPAWKPIKSL